MKMGQLNNSYRHNERVNKNYSNDSIDRSKSDMNYYFKKPEGSYEKTFWQIKEDNHYLGNLRLKGAKQSNVACEFILDVNAKYFKNLGEEGTKQYYKDAYDFCIEKCGEKNIISAVVHVDEDHPHMHVVYVPVVKGKDRKGNPCERINCSVFWEGKDSYQKLQDDFHSYMTEKGYNLLRGKPKSETNRDHMTVAEFKNEKSKELEQLRQNYESEINKLKLMVNDLQNTGEQPGGKTLTGKLYYTVDQYDKLFSAYKLLRASQNEINNKYIELSSKYDKLFKSNENLVEFKNKLVESSKSVLNQIKCYEYALNKAVDNDKELKDKLLVEAQEKALELIREPDKGKINNKKKYHPSGTDEFGA